MPVGISFAFYFCLINCVRNSKTIRSQKRKKGKKGKTFPVFFVKYLQAKYLWSTSFQRIRSKYSSKLVKIFCFLFVLMWNTYNNLLPHIRIVCNVRQELHSLYQGHFQSSCLYSLWHMPPLFFLCPISLLIVPSSFCFSHSAMQLYIFRLWFSLAAIV